MLFKYIHGDNTTKATVMASERNSVTRSQLYTAVDAGTYRAVHTYTGLSRAIQIFTVNRVIHTGTIMQHFV